MATQPLPALPTGETCWLNSPLGHITICGPLVGQRCNDVSASAAVRQALSLSSSSGAPCSSVWAFSNNIARAAYALTAS